MSQNILRNKIQEDEKLGRKDLIQSLGIGILAGILLKAFNGKKLLAEEVKLPKDVELPELPPPQEGEDPILRMMRDLQRALKKPIEQRRWIMVIDTRKCVGCHACTISCVSENNLPPGTVYRPVFEEEIGTYPNVSMRFTPRPCMQCNNPPCVGVCPVHATWKRKDGIVEIDYEQCIGCRYCITACPYSARVFDSGHYYTNKTPKSNEFVFGKDRAKSYEEQASFEYGIAWEREEGKSPIGNARKCQFCLHRIERGLLPECVVTCIGRATYFGDGNDPESLVSQLKGKSNVLKLKEEMGTDPNVYYLI